MTLQPLIAEATTYSVLADWQAEATRRFGGDALCWQFVCPSCGYVAAVKDWKDAGASDGEAAFSCVGRRLGADGKNTFRAAGGPCNYAGGGLFGLNPVTVHDENGKPHRVFAFAPADVEGC